VRQATETTRLLPVRRTWAVKRKANLLPRSALRAHLGEAQGLKHELHVRERHGAHLPYKGGSAEGQRKVLGA
jgi:hypothetical protein